MNILIINNDKSEFFNITKHLASKLNENNEYINNDIDDIEYYMNTYNIPIYEVISNILFSNTNSKIINIKSLDLLNDNIYLKYVINSTNTIVLNFNSEKFTKNDILIKESEFIKDIKDKIKKYQKNSEKNNELLIASKILNGNGLFLFNNKISNASKLCLIPGPPNQPIYFSEFAKTLITINDEKFYQTFLNNNVVFVREYSPVHEVVSKIFEKRANI